ncbi:MAG TPA: homoserine dehydrogenase [Blastocatellia bacterium]|nr:homoserine dehydrogenase [Blastocatellia bacterium]
MRLKIAFIGMGNVARAFARLLIAHSSGLAERYRLEWVTVAIATGRHGSAVSGLGIDLPDALKLLEQDRGLAGLAGAHVPGSSVASEPMGAIEQAGPDVIFETIPLNPVDGQPAIDYIRRALSLGIHVVTANKGPIAFAYDELSMLAKLNGARFRFEGTVMDGTPVFNLERYCLPAARVIDFAGVLNSTTNLILTGLQSGISFEKSLREAQRLGIAEANADYDIDGWDAAMKATALANVWMDASLDPRQVERRGIREIREANLIEAKATGQTVRLIARGRRVGESVKVSVGPEQVPIDSPLGCVRGTSNALIIRTDLMGEIAIVETDPGVEQTAYALMSDFVRIHQDIVETRGEC